MTIDEELRSFIFGKKIQKPDENSVKEANEHLIKHNLNEKKVDFLKEIENIELPNLIGKHINRHFTSIANKQNKGYFKSICQLALHDLPQMPKEFSYTAGWTKYEKDTGKQTKVEYPHDKVLVFDVETLVLEENRPIIAVAVSTDAWYSWCSESLFNENYSASAQLTLNDLIPLESSDLKTRQTRKRIVIGHNVGFDRSFIKEQYYLEVFLKPFCVNLNKKLIL